ncbi:uncharacterized protein [Bemisia tabaci]|uniref:uncharacterized protein isoform X2 n=1 Tax=Bemisia tabaci TaxID=7038 RepID=UPI003B287077
MRPFHIFFLACVCYEAASTHAATHFSKETSGIGATEPRSFFHNFHINYPYLWNTWSLLPNRPRGQNEDLSSSQTNVNNLGAASNGHLGIGLTIDYGKRTEAGLSQAATDTTQETINDTDAPISVTETGAGAGLEAPSKTRATTTETPSNFNKDATNPQPIIILDAATFLALNRDQIQAPQPTVNLHQTGVAASEKIEHTEYPDPQLLSLPSSPFVSESRVNFSSGNLVFQVETKNYSSDLGLRTESIAKHPENTANFDIIAAPSNVAANYTPSENTSNINAVKSEVLVSENDVTVSSSTTITPALKDDVAKESETTSKNETGVEKDLSAGPEEGKKKPSVLPTSSTISPIPTSKTSGPPLLIRAHYYPVSGNFWYPHNGPYHSYTTEYAPPPQVYQEPQAYQSPQVFFTNGYSATSQYDRPAELYGRPQKPIFTPAAAAPADGYGEASFYNYKPATKPVYLTKGTTPYRGVTIYLESEPEPTTPVPSTVFSASEVTTEKPSINSWFRPPQFISNIISVLHKDNVGKPRDKVKPTPTPKPPSRAFH